MKLFEDPDRQQRPAAPASGRVVGVTVNANLWPTFDYRWPDSLGRPAPGQRVRVPFGKANRSTLAFVVEADKPASRTDLKCVAEAIDDQPLLDAPLWALARWISRYYLCPLGMTLAAMLPSAVGRRPPRTETVAYLAAERDAWPRKLGPRQRRILDELLEARRQGIEPIELTSLLSHSGSSRETANRLIGRGMIRTEQRRVRLTSPAGAEAPDPFEINADQTAALDAIAGKLEGRFSCTLLHGVTGSGKTEVYIRAIRRVIDAGRQAIVLVPEIALATQTLQRLIARLPRVAVLHSGLTPAQRAFYHEQIREGHASVVVGPRSAVFAPARKLGLIVVDEEHEPSYKQDNSPRYHGRDVAIKRAALEEIPVVLGSATPSLESLYNARAGRYDLVRLPRRVRGLPLPHLEIVNLRKEIQPGRIELLGATLTRRMAATLDRGEQIILLMNRRGYASYVFCPKCEWKLSCDQCTRLLVFHRATRLAMCHYCEKTAPVPERCPACRGKLVFFGYGIQRIDSELERKFPSARVARMDSDTMTSPAQFTRVLGEFGEGKIDILLGTQMVAKGLDFPRVSLVGVVSADTSLAIPDFRAAERTFQLIVQVAGRAGRSDRPGEVIVQTVHPDEPAIQQAAKHDYDGFVESELPARRDTRLPPFRRLVRLLTRHEKLSRAEDGAAKLAATLRRIMPADKVAIYGPQPAAVKKIKNLFRFQVLLAASAGGVVQDVLAPRIEALTRDCPAELVADVDPVQLM
jgi:primosomal protein N' (replication factor Y)